MTDGAIFSDPELRVVTVERIDGTTITRDDGWSFGWSEKYGALPKIGDTLLMAGSIGRPIRGIAVNGKQRHYHTEEEAAAEHKAKVEAEARADRIESYLAQDQGPRLVWIGKYYALPEVFQRRIQKFVGERDDWIRRFGNYEMSVCVDGARVGDWLQVNGVTEENYQLFKSGRPPIELWDGHSGNSYDIACLLGWWYATDPEMVVAEHGALVPLVGCIEYGCPHPDDKTPDTS
jgi:hypothetical protein